MPTEVDENVGTFDQFASKVSRFSARAAFFIGCCLLILIWVPTVLFLEFDTWQLLINTATTIITFLMVALIQNTQYRDNQATQHKLNAIADALSDLMEDEYAKDAAELRAAVGIEEREST